MSWHRLSPQGLLLEVHACPGARKTGIAGIFEDRLKIRLAARPKEGEANLALVEFLSEVFAIPKTRVLLLKGASGRKKQFLLQGISCLPPTLLPPDAL